MIQKSSSSPRTPNSTSAVAEADRDRQQFGARIVVGLCTALILTACNGSPVVSQELPVNSPEMTVGPPELSTVDGSTAVPDPSTAPVDLQLVTELVSTINATAGGPVQTQRALLEQRTHPDYLSEQQQCAPATITIGLDPVLANLAPTPGWTPTAAPSTGQTAEPAVIPTGTLYRLPVLVLVYTDTRRTGTDLTSLRIAVLDGRAVLFPLCLN